MDVHLVDGTYELFRYFFGMPSRATAQDGEVAATGGVLGSVLSMLEHGATHVGVATDHVIESFRNRLWADYKTDEGVDPRLLAQFPLLEEGLAAMGVQVWPMIEFEADDALASAAWRAAASAEVDRVYICTPDKDLAQCVRDGRIVQLVRRTGVVIDEAGVEAKFGVLPRSIPDYLALVGDSADGFPGLAGWGAASAGAVLRRYESLEAIPLDAPWDVAVRGAEPLRRILREQFTLALLFRDLATLRAHAVEFGSVEELEWRAPRADFEDFCRRIETPTLLERALRLARVP